jgi:L-ascorbate metabolism protein UlaG (beta-lactamase superfamily)
MSEKKFYFKPNVLIEPLFGRWYAWPQLVYPASAAMYVANLHLNIMRSYVKAPQVHAAAVKNPALLGGPFIDYEVNRAAEIKQLLEQTLAEQAELIDFAAAVKSLDQMLKGEAKGHSLEPLYEKVPAALRGYVELVYDLNNHPSMRFLEGLLYRSPLYNPALQSVSLSLVEQDYRPFVLSTPRLPGDERLQLNLPFAHEGIDELCRMRSEPQTFGHVREAVGLEARDEEMFRSLLTEERPAARRAPKFDGEGVRVRYFGHACVLIESAGVSILTDPAVSYDYENDIQRYTFADLPDVIDYVLITHTHQDHVLLETLLQLRCRVRNVVVPRSGGGTLADPSLKRILKAAGFGNVVELDELETLDIEGGSVTGIPFFGEHGDLDIRTKVAHLVRLEGRTVLLAADSNNIEPQLYRHVREAVGPLDVMFLGMECDGAPLSWVYGPLLTQPIDRKMDQSRRLTGSDYQRAMDIVSRFDCRQVYVYAMGQEPWLNHIMCLRYRDDSPQITESNKLVAECRARGIRSERLFGMKEVLL